MIRAGPRILLSLLLLPFALAIAPGHATGGLSSARATVNVPRVVGLRSQTAARRLRAVGLHVSVSTVHVDRPRGTVVAQRPRAGSVVRVGSVVHLSVAAPVTVRVPDLVGLSSDAAAARLRELSLTPYIVSVHSLQPAGNVVAQEPAAGTSVVRGTRVTISVSGGPGP
jgi:eukaryotic-like serine/threonine-protein kinase